jgi:type VI secretion system secreted protein VgrG
MKFLTYHVRTTRARSAGGIGLLLIAVLVTLSFAGSALSAQATVNLGNVDSFGALSATAMTNSGANTVVHGNIGSSTSIGAGVTHPGFAAYGAGSPELANAQAALLTAYGAAEAAAPNQPSITGANLAGRTLFPGVYNSTSDILISGPVALKLDGNGDPSSVFIFQAASSGNLTVDPTSSITYTNGAQPCNVFWKVNSAFLKNTDHVFVGTILALTQITLTENITVEGRVLARNADVTFIHDTINKPTCSAGTPTTTTSTTTTSTTPSTTTSTTTTPRVIPKLKKKSPKATTKRKVVAPKVTPKPRRPQITQPPKPPKHHAGFTG